ncbi:MAG: heparan-alpha-glucosaminide N-acetyltransferase domain-containing protein [Ferruginibacter sp.]
MKRIQSIDFVRGVVMIIMALDHVRDLIHVDSITQSPTNLETTSPALFFTRWITYLCAPTFVFLAGTSAYISLKNSNDVVKTRKFLLKRGLYLVLLEFIVVNFLIFFDPGYNMLLWEVIATIGFGFIILSLVINFSWKSIAILGLLIIFFHNLTPFLPFAETSVIKRVLMPFFAPAALPMPGGIFVVGYPPIPWLGIMLAGFAAGKLFERDQTGRKRIFILIGTAAVLLFVMIRFINIYGDSQPWSAQKTSLLTFLSFMNVSKYPPSLVFCLITLGIMFLMLSLSEGLKSKLVNVVSVYGKVPLFYFLVHFFVIHLIMLVIMLLQGFSWSQLDFASGSFGRPKDVVSGLSLFNIYILWIAIVVALYFPCKWYGQYKQTHNKGWLKYL